VFKYSLATFSKKSAMNVKVKLDTDETERIKLFVESTAEGPTHVLLVSDKQHIALGSDSENIGEVCE